MKNIAVHRGVLAAAGALNAATIASIPCIHDWTWHPGAVMLTGLMLAALMTIEAWRMTTAQDHPYQNQMILFTATFTLQICASIWLSTLNETPQAQWTLMAEVAVQMAAVAAYLGLGTWMIAQNRRKLMPLILREK